MTEYIFIATYQEKVGLFLAQTEDRARIMAWEALQSIVDNPEPELFSVRPATQQEVDDIYAVTNFNLDGEILEPEIKSSREMLEQVGVEFTAQNKTSAQ